MCAEMQSSGGVYHPFTPVDQSPNKGCGMTLDTDMLILGKTVAEHVELSSDVTLTATENRQFSIVMLTKDKRCFDTALYGLNGNHLESGSQAYLLVFGGRGDTLEIELTALGAGTLKIGDESFALTPEWQTFSASVHNSSAIPVSVEGVGAEILTYTTK